MAIDSWLQKALFLFIEQKLKQKISGPWWELGICLHTMHMHVNAHRCAHYKCAVFKMSIAKKKKSRKKHF